MTPSTQPIKTERELAQERALANWHAALATGHNVKGHPITR